MSFRELQYILSIQTLICVIKSSPVIGNKSYLWLRDDRRWYCGHAGRVSITSIPRTKPAISQRSRTGEPYRIQPWSQKYTHEYDALPPCQQKLDVYMVQTSEGACTETSGKSTKVQLYGERSWQSRRYMRQTFLDNHLDVIPLCDPICGNYRR
jgi:hypothetical protein